MTDIQKLKSLAEAATVGDKPASTPISELIGAMDSLRAAANPAAVLELIAEIERQAAQFKEWQASHHANYCAVADERDQLKAENEALRKALTAIRDNSSSIWACEVAADALVDSRKESAQ